MIIYWDLRWLLRRCVSFLVLSFVFLRIFWLNFHSVLFQTLIAFFFLSICFSFVVLSVISFVVALCMFFCVSCTWLCRSSKSFVSQLLASAHGLREFSLPSGERHRLRYVQPWSPSDSATLLKSTDSPFHVPNSKDHKEILISTGGTIVVVLDPTLGDLIYSTSLKFIRCFCVSLGLSCLLLWDQFVYCLLCFCVVLNSIL